MKKLALTLLTVLTSGAVYALPVGNPADASLLCDGLFMEGSCCLDACDPCASWCDALSFRVGFYGDYVFNRHLKIDSNDSYADIEESVLNTNAAIVTMNIWDRLDVFATLGASHLFISTNASAFQGAAGELYEIETETDFSWSAGLRATLWECGCTTLGAEFQYFYTRPDVSRVVQGEDAAVYPHNVQAKYQEWQFGIGISHRINMIVPYAAMKWGATKVNFDDAIIDFPGSVPPTTVLDDLKNQKDWGYAVGLSLIDCDKASFTAEARFSDEKAVHIRAEVRI